VRILMTADTLGGVFSYAVDLIRGLQTRGLEVVLATMGRPPSAAQRAQLSELPNLELHHSAWALEWMEQPWSDLRSTGIWLERLARRVAPDLIHLNHFSHGALDWRAPVVMVGHSCVQSWWQAVHREQAPAKYQPYREVVRNGLRAADIVVAPTQAMLDCLTEHYAPFARTRVVPNGIELAGYAPRVKEPFVLAAGRLWDPAKNIGALESIAPALAWPVCVAGEAAAPQLPANTFKACQPLGELSRAALSDWMARAAIYALPARYEPFGLSVLEAAASGCALVLGSLPSLLENWHDTALFVDPGDLDALQRALTGLIADRAHRNMLGARARQRAQAFSVARMADAYLRIYQELGASTRTGAVPCAS
jgi:glycogen(starch) synthase